MFKILLFSSLMLVSNLSWSAPCLDMFQYGNHDAFARPGLQMYTKHMGQGTLTSPCFYHESPPFFDPYDLGIYDPVYGPWSHPELPFPHPDRLPEEGEDENREDPLGCDEREYFAKNCPVGQENYYKVYDVEDKKICKLACRDARPEVDPNLPNGCTPENTKKYTNTCHSGYVIKTILDSERNECREVCERPLENECKDYITSLDSYTYKDGEGKVQTVAPDGVLDTNNEKYTDLICGLDKKMVLTKKDGQCGFECVPYGEKDRETQKCAETVSEEEIKRLSPKENIIARECLRREKYGFKLYRNPNNCSEIKCIPPEPYGRECVEIELRKEKCGPDEVVEIQKDERDENGELTGLTDKHWLEGKCKEICVPRPSRRLPKNMKCEWLEHQIQFLQVPKKEGRICSQEDLCTGTVICEETPSTEGTPKEEQSEKRQNIAPGEWPEKPYHPTVECKVKDKDAKKKSGVCPVTPENCVVISE